MPNTTIKLKDDSINLDKGNFSGNVEKAIKLIQDFCNKNTVTIESFGYGYGEVVINGIKNDYNPYGIDIDMMLAWCKIKPEDVLAASASAASSSGAELLPSAPSSSAAVPLGTILSSASALFAHPTQAWNEAWSFSVDNNELIFKGSTNAHLDLACKAVLDPARNIVSAIFNVQVESGWYGVRFRVNNLSLNPIQTLLGNADCKLTKVTIHDTSLTLRELNTLCVMVPEKTTLKQFNAGDLVLETEADKTTFSELQKKLAARGIALEAKTSYEPTFGTTYH